MTKKYEIISDIEREIQSDIEREIIMTRIERMDEGMRIDFLERLQRGLRDDRETIGERYSLDELAAILQQVMLDHEQKK